MFIPVSTAQEMGKWDTNAQQSGLFEMLLMENAAKQAVDLLASLHHVQGKDIWLFMGAGNNGGDAACMARYLQDMGATCLVLHTKELELYSETIQTHARLAEQNNVRFEHVTDTFSCLELLQAHPYPDIVVDAILGTGFKGELREKEKKLITFINSICNKSWVLSIDIPSGMNADSGDICPIAVRAHATISFQAAKPALLLPHTRVHVGELFIRSIGIPKYLRSPTSYCMWSPFHDFSLNSHGSLEHSPIPAQNKDAFNPKHKGESGHILIYGTSSEYTGASILAARGAIHSGVGLVSIVANDHVIEAVQAQLPEAMTQNIQNFELNESSADVFIVGPGMGRSEKNKELFISFLEARTSAMSHKPVIFDADALYFFAHEPALLNYVLPCDILTPHPSEASHILGMDTATVQKNRFEALEHLKKIKECIWVLKGAGTLVGTHNVPSFICPIASSSLAVGGSGDVLAGAIAALLARRFTPPLFDFIAVPEHIQKSFAAASIGVQIHGQAGLILQQAHIQGGAREIAKALTKASIGITRNS